MDISGTTIGKPQTARDLTHEYVFMSLTIYIIQTLRIYVWASGRN